MDCCACPFLPFGLTQSNPYHPMPASSLTLCLRFVDIHSGCALAIAYKSNVKDVKPEDFVVFTVVHDCPKRMREPIDVPNLPACPNGKCTCAWFWLPRSGSGLKNFYMTPFVCHVDGASPNASPVDVEYAIPPRRCLDPTLCKLVPVFVHFFVEGIFDNLEFLPR